MKLYRFLTLLVAGTLLYASLAGIPLFGASAESLTTYEDEDLLDTYDAETAVNVLFSQDEVSAVDGVEIGEGTAKFTKAGVYVLSGEYDGQIIVEVGNDDNVQLVLNGLTVNCENGPALYVLSADKVILTLEEGSVNALTDGENYEQDDNGADGAIFSKDDLSINGKGALTVTGQTAHGIVSKDSLIVAGGEISVSAVKDALRGKDEVSICGGEIALSAQSDGIKSTEDEDAEKGYVAIDGGTITITAAERGIAAETDIGITAGNVVIAAGDDSAHANGNITVSGGTLDLSAGDDGIHAEFTCTISGGTINVVESVEGIEASEILLTGGEININASDDGINASTDSGETAVSDAAQTAGTQDAAQTGDTFAARPETGGMRGNMGGMMDENDGSVITISGGYITINASGDGIDSNGDFTISGGTINVSGSTNSGDGALDAAGELNVTGGVIVAAGSAGMAQMPDSASQVVAMVYFDEPQAAGTRVSVMDVQGNLLLEYAPEKEFACVMVSSPVMEINTQYTFYKNGDAVFAFVAEDTLAAYDGEGNETTLQGMGGFGQENFGGMPNNASGEMPAFEGGARAGQARGGDASDTATPPADNGLTAPDASAGACA